MLVDKISGGIVDLDDYWVCIDARPLNAKNRSKKFVLPKIADVIEKAKKATMMADLDLQNAFHQILLEIKLKTTHKFVESQAAKAVVGQTIY